jgi:hypothetical protein
MIIITKKTIYKKIISQFTGTASSLRRAKKWPITSEMGGNKGRI